MQTYCKVARLSNGLIGNTLARDEKDLCDIGLMLCFKGRRAGDAAGVTFRFFDE